MANRCGTRQAALLGVLVCGCVAAEPEGSPGGADKSAWPADVEHLTAVVIEEYPHDPRAYTQGLLVDEDEFLFESTGLRGESTLRRVDYRSGEIDRMVELPADVFGEGIARAGDELTQLTWESGSAFRWNAATFERLAELPLQHPRRRRGPEDPGVVEGWGLCFDGTDLILSDGSDSLYRLDPAGLKVRKVVPVGVRFLNELECVAGDVYANVYRSNDDDDAHEILRIDGSTGTVTATIDASALYERLSIRPGKWDVLNGIAYLGNDRFLLTGKRWPSLFEVELQPSE